MCRLAHAALVLLGLMTLWAHEPGRALACATCSVGDPTLTSMGLQQPFAGRLRASAEVSHRSERVGTRDVDRIELTEQRMSAALAYAPSRNLLATIQVPVVARQVRLVNLAEERFVGLGDVELRGRLVVVRDREIAPRHLLSLVVGVRVPTAPLRQDARGQLPAEMQTGTGAFTPIAGFSYAMFSGPLSVYASEVLLTPLPGRAAFQAGHAWLGTHAVQYQFDPSFALRLGANLRLDTPPQERGRTEPDGGGLVVFAAPAVLLGPVTDLVVYIEAALPALQRTRGHFAEGPLLTLGAAYDF